MVLEVVELEGLLNTYMETGKMSWSDSFLIDVDL